MKKIEKKSLTLLMLVMLIVCSILGTTDAWAHGTHYGKATVAKNGNGTVYLATSNSAASGNTTETWSCGASSSKDSQTYYAFAKPDAGWAFNGWTLSSNSGSLDNASANPAKWTTQSATSTNSGSPTTSTVTATFARSTAALANGVYITLEKNANVAGSATFTTTNADNTNDFETPTITGTGFSNATCASWNANTLTVNYTFNAGGTTGEHTANLQMTSANGGTPTNHTVTVHVAGLGEADGTGVATENLTQVVNGTATIETSYLTSQSQLVAPTISNISGGGDFSLTSWSWEGNVLTVNYTFDPQGVEGTTTADLNVAINATTGDSKVYQLMATATAPVAYEAEVEENSVIVKTGTFAECLAHANTLSTNPTLRLRNNVSGITAKQSITKSMTLDLNSQTISGTMTTADGMLDVNGAGIVVTITDNSPKKEGKISNVNNVKKYLYAVYVTKGTLNFEEGYVHSENTYGTASSDYRAIGIGTAAGTTLNVTGGIIEGVSTKDYANGIYSYGTTNISGGEIIGTGYNAARGIVIYNGTTTMTGGTVKATTTGTTDAKGVYMSSSAAGVFNLNGGEVICNAKTTTTNGLYMGVAGATINVSGGSVKAISTTTTAYGIFDDKGGHINITGGTIEASADQTTVAAVHLAVATADCKISGGEFYATAGGTNRTSAGDVNAYGLYVAKSGLTMNITGTPHFEAKVTRSKFGRRAYGMYIVNGATVNVDGAAEFVGNSYFQYSYGAYVQYGGKLNAKDAKFNANARQYAYGLLVQSTTSSTTGALLQGQAELTNVTAIGVTDSLSAAYGLSFENNSRVITGGTAYDGYYAGASKVIVHGGRFEGRSETSSGYGIVTNSRAGHNDVLMADVIDSTALAYPELLVDGDAYCYGYAKTSTGVGLYTGGYATITGGTYIGETGTESAQGIYVNEGWAHISGATATATAHTKNAYGVLVNAGVADNTGIITKGWAELTDVTATATTETGANANGVRVVSAQKTTTSTAAGHRPGEWAAAASAVIHSGTYKATAATTTGHAVYVTGRSITADEGAEATSTCKIEDGRFMVLGTTDSPARDILNAAQDGKNILIENGLFKNQTDLSFYTADDKVVHALKSGEEGYSEGYRYIIDGIRYGDPVCKNGTKTYLTLEEALDDVNSGKVSGGTIEMLLPYTLPAGNYILPKGCTLLIPYKSNQGSAIGDKSSNLNHHTAADYGPWIPAFCFKKLTFASGVNMQVYGTIEASAQQHCMTGSNNGTNGATASVNGPYGELHLDEGSSITLNTDPTDRTKGGILRAWGYVTGKGEITAQRGATIREMFQVSDWKGGTNLKDNGFANGSSCHRVFPINQYYIQNVQAPTIYRPGSHLKTSFHMTAKVLSVSIYGSDDVNIVGEYRSASDKDVALFLMNTATDDKDTWVRKEFDAENDLQVYTISSAAFLSAMTIPTGVAGNITSSSYDLPITNNMKILVDNGTLEVTENMVMLPGSEIEINHDATLKINSGKHLSLYDNAEWSTYAYSGKYTQTVPYCTEWKTSPRRNTLAAQKDAAINVHGTIQVDGFLFTTAGGANIYSSNKDAGHVIFPSSTAAGVQSGVTVSQWKSSGFVDAPYTSAKLRNEGDEDFTPTDGAKNGKDYCYSEGRWQCWENVGCFHVDKSDDANWKWYGQPSDFVQLKPNAENNQTAPVLDEDHLYPNVDETRFCILLDDCMWREVSLVDDGLVYCEDKDTYYEWNSTLSQWEEKFFTIVWKNWDNSVLNTYNFVKYNTMPKWLSATPTKAKQAGDPAGSYYIFSGWTPDLDIVTKDATYTATYELIVPKYDVLWKNEDGSKTLHISRWAEGEHPAYDGAEIKKATSMVGVDLAHNGWSTAANGAGTRYGLTDELPAMGAAAQTYYATFAEGSIITWKNEDGTVLDRKLWAAGTRPTHANINKESDAQYDYVFAGWTPEVLPVEADAEYTAVFTPVLRQYAITFSNLNGKGSSQVVNVNYGATPVCPVTPDRGNSAEYSYEWTGWKDGAGNTYGTDYVFPAVAGDATYTATFSQTTRTYTVTWKNEDGSVLERVRGLAVGDAVPDYSGATPEKEPTRYLVYGFTGWTPAKKATIDAEGDQEYRATYDAGSTRYYTVRWLMDNGDLIDETHLEYDQMPTHADPTKASTALYSYDFAGWTPAISAVKGDAEYKATFNAIHRQYEITYVLYDDVKNVVRYEAEAAVATPADPTREGYTFVRWDKDIPATMPAEDMTITASWTPVSYTITYEGLEGASNSNPTSYTIESATINFVDPGERVGYTFDGWTPASIATGSTGNKTITASWRVNQVSITFNTNGGTAIAPIEQEVGTAITAPEDPFRDGYIFEGWDAEIPSTMPSTSMEITAIWTPESGAVLDIVDWDATTVTLNMNGYSSDLGAWAVETNSVTKAAGNRETDRTLVMNREAATADKYIRIKTYGGVSLDGEKHYVSGGTLDGDRIYKVPHIISGTVNASTLSTNANSILYVKSGKLTIDANKTVHEVIVNEGAELEIESGKTLKTDKLVLRTKAFESAELTNNGTLTCAQVYYTRIVADKSQSYQFALPFDVDSLSDVKFSNGRRAPLGNAWGLNKYDAQRRADKGEGGNWVGVNPKEVTKLEKDTGYQILSTSAYYTELYFPVTYAKVADGAKVAVALHGGAAATDNPMNANWNYISSPYTHKYKCSYTDPSEAIVINELNEDNRTFSQHPADTIYPARPFYYQAKAAGNLTFGSYFYVEAPASVAARNAASNAVLPTQWLQLFYEDANGTKDQTNILLNNRFTANFETGYDVEKMSLAGARPFIYSVLPCGNLAVTVVSDSIAEASIPLSVYAPAAGEMTFSLRDNEHLSRLEHVYLTDTQMGVVTDLLADDYLYVAEEGTAAGRFFLQAVFGAPGVATDVENLNGNGAAQFEYHMDGNQLVISNLAEGTVVRLYDAAGRLMMTTSAASETLRLTAPATGVYILQVGSKRTKVVLDK